jgi:polysaccharide export outer membrane protein
MSRRNLRFGTTVYVLLCLLTASLAAGAQGNRESATAPPAPTAEDPQLRKAVGAPIDPKTYLIGPEDILNIRVWREADLSGPAGVRPDGKISLPLLGDVQAGGETPERLAAVLTEAFSKFVTNPEVMVSVAAVNSKKYFVSGGVARSGSYPLVVPTTISEALAIAGGFREYAKKKGVIIMRGAKRLKFNYRDFERGKALQQNILLENGDHIIVPE